MKKYILNQKFKVGLLLLLTISSSFTSMAFIYIVQNIVDSMLKSDRLLFYYTIIFLIISLISNYILGYLSSLQEAKVIQNIHINLKKDIFWAMINQKFDSFKKTSIGEKISTFENDVNMIEQYYFNNIFLVLQNSILLAFSLTYLFLLNFFLAMILIISAIVILLLPLFVGRNIDKLSNSYSQNKGKFIAQIKDFFSGIDVIKAYKIEPQVNKNYTLILNRLENGLFLLKKRICLYSQTMITGNYLIIAICFSIGGLMTISGQISLGQLIAITQVMNIIIQPMGLISSAIVEINGGKKIRERIENIINFNKEKDIKVLNTKNIPFEKIECKNVSYLIDNQSVILKNINILIESNKKYAIVGPSGSGKTTLLKILAHYLDISSGNLLINGLEYTECNSSLINDISFVYQDTFIFEDTLKNNICLYQAYDTNAVKKAIKLSELTNLIDEKKNGMDFLCQEGGENLSGGEKQRISIARAILRNTSIILMDEITSALDTNTSRKIEDNLLNLKDRTIVFVTHKLDKNFLEKMDCIFCINKGEIVESGDFTTLLEMKRHFFSLYWYSN